MTDSHASLDRAWLDAVEVDDARDKRNSERARNLPPCNVRAFCREPRSRFCPCAAPWMYADKPGVARAWFEVGDRASHQNGFEAVLPVELDWGEGEQGGFF